jgi:putative heme-binding domain-containing protein
MRFFVLASMLLFCGSFSTLAHGQTPVDAHWIWFDEGDPAASVPAGKVWFRIEVRGDEPSTGSVRIACDDQFTLWVNGNKIGTGGGPESFRYILNGIVDRGVNVIAVEATNTDGRAGLLVDGEVRGQSGRATSFDSGPEWRATRDAPQGDAWLKPGFDTSAWTPVKDLGAHEDSPWSAISFAETYLDRYQVPEGFQLTRIGEPNLVGSLVAFTWGNRGRLIASREKGPIVSVIDRDSDGVYDDVVEYSRDVTNCQGLCMVGDTLYAVGEGPHGTGMYRLPDLDANDLADGVELVTGYKGKMAEHGPHDVVLGPDGWLYHNLGNHAWIQHEPRPTSPTLFFYEGDLLRPRLEDPNGHAVGIPAPGGTIWRFSPDGVEWYLTTNGFRNHYDIAFNAAGDLFTFDSDMEWEVGMPFYRPVRVFHCTEGAEFGWRSNAGKWLPYYLDALPGTVDVGRGSPTGVVFYEHRQFPAPYHGAFIAADWSMGRILAVSLRPEGASFTGSYETLVSGNPLNVSDVEVDRDGSLVFSTGGRGTEGGLYRVTYVGQDAPAPSLPKADSVADVLRLPQPSAAWSRELAIQAKQTLGAAWATDLEQAARNGSPVEQVRALSLMAQQGPPPATELLVELSTARSPQTRAFACWLLGDRPEPAAAQALAKLLSDADPTVQRRASEAFVRSGQPAPLDPLLKLLASDDRHVRFHARKALERVPLEQWRGPILKIANPRVATAGLLALHNLGPDALSAEAALRRELSLWDACWNSSDAGARTDLLRMIELTLLADPSVAANSDLSRRLLEVFPQGSARSRGPDDTAVNMEVSRLLCFLQAPEAAFRLTDAMRRAESRELQIHYAFVTSYLKKGWDTDLDRRLLDWYETTQTWEGGHSFGRWIENIMIGHIDRFTPEERATLLASWAERPFATRLLLRQTDPAATPGFDAIVRRIIADLESQPGTPGGEELVGVAIDALAKSDNPDSQAALLKLFDEVPDRRDQIVRGIAQHPSPAAWPYLVRSLDFADSTTLQLAIGALRAIDQAPEKPAAVRSAILAGLKLGDQGGLPAAALLEKWTGEPHDPATGGAAAIADYQAWFRDAFPDEPAPDLPAVDVSRSKYTFAQLLDYLDGTPEGRAGDVARGQAVFRKANCVKCHKFGAEGEGVGPDLTTVRRRFQRREIIESLVAPSQVISDQYRSVTLLTVDGQIHTGLPLPNQGEGKVVLLLSDAKRLEIPDDQIDEMRPATLSVMPEGALKDLTLTDIADLFAFLETSKQNPEPPKAAAASGN